MLQTEKTEARLPIITCAVLCCISLAFGFWHINRLTPHGDASIYFDTIQYMQGNEEAIKMGGIQSAEISRKVVMSRMLASPALLYGAILIEKVTRSTELSMLAINFFFSICLLVLFYIFSKNLLKNDWAAAFATILLSTNYEFLYSGPSFMADAGGWFFFLLGSFFALKFYQAPNQLKFMLLSALAASVGLLFKENGGFGFLTLLAAILFAKETSWSWKIKKAFQSGLIMLSLPAIYHIYFYFQYHFTYLDWYRHAHYYHAEDVRTAGTITQRMALLAKILGWVFLPGWLLSFYGLIKLKAAVPEIRNAILIFLPASLAFLIWPAQVQRIAFIVVPWLCLVAAYGLGTIKNKYLAVLLLFVYITVNFNLRWLMDVINLPI